MVKLQLKHVAVERISQASGHKHIMTLPMSPEEYARKMRAWRQGALIQDAFPDLDDEQREFLLSGITPQEWEALFGGAE